MNPIRDPPQCNMDNSFITKQDENHLEYHVDILFIHLCILLSNLEGMCVMSVCCCSKTQHYLVRTMSDFDHIQNRTDQCASVYSCYTRFIILVQ